jgi:hypothetical protein
MEVSPSKGSMKSFPEDADGTSKPAAFAVPGPVALPMMAGGINSSTVKLVHTDVRVGTIRCLRLYNGRQRSLQAAEDQALMQVH